MTNYLARICERDGGTPIGNQNFGTKPNIDQNAIGSQLFGRASIGNKPNIPYRPRAIQKVYVLEPEQQLLA